MIFERMLALGFIKEIGIHEYLVIIEDPAEADVLVAQELESYDCYDMDDIAQYYRIDGIEYVLYWFDPSEI